MIGVLLAVGKKERQVVGDGFVDPLIAIGAPANNVAPPLMSHFVKGHQLREMLLPACGEPGALLRRGRKEGKRGDVKKSGPALSEGSRDLGNAELLEGKRPAVIFVETNGRVDMAPQLLQYVRRAGRGGNHRYHIRGLLPLGPRRRGHARDIETRRAETIVEGLL